MTRIETKFSSIKKLERNAKNGVFDSNYQLYEYYSNGTYVAKDVDKAEDYLQAAYEIFKNQKLEIDFVGLQNFRAFDSFNLKIPDRSLTVIVGSNGGGKSTLLDAIYYNLTWLHNRMTKNGGSGESIADLDLTLGSKAGFSSIITKFKLNKNVSADFELVHVKDGVDTSKKSHIKEVTKIGNMYKKAKLIDEKVNLPLLAYFNVERALDINNKDFSSFDETASLRESDQFEGLSDSLKGKVDFKNFFRWYKRLDDIEKHQKVKKDTDFLKEIANIENSGLSDEDILKLVKLRAKRSETKSSKYIQETKAILDNVIPLFMPGYSGLEIQVQPYLSLTVEKNQQKLNVLQLSQGEKTLLALVLDIARRLIILNPSLPNPLDGNGIILIDEIDLHLHPEWQRNVIKGLTKAFKNCQFIVTTHSPQIVSEVKYGQVVVMKRNENNNIEYFQPSQSYGLSSNDILNEIMADSSINKQLTRNDKVEEELNQIHSLIAEGLYVKAQSLIDELERQINGEIPELVSAKVDIDLANWEE
ncbi:AAA family ATPase [Aliiglaciecola aliphaticivorans]